VQFVDGDCEFIPGWFEQGAKALESRPDVAVVCGRVRERHPEASVYNLLCDLEWDAPPGETDACGGIALMRVAPVRAVGGFRAGLIAGEEPELCARLRAAGWKVLRLPADMAWHDAALTRFGQWWRRAVRSGHACAELTRLHGRGPLRDWARAAASNWFWGLLLPLAALGLAWWTWGLSLLLLLLGYPLLAWRVYRGQRRRGRPRRAAALYGGFIALSKFPQALGQVRYHRDRIFKRASTIIEYKAPRSPTV
jgi:GT2 family glycosyltransferase